MMPVSDTARFPQRGAVSFWYCQGQGSTVQPRRCRVPAGGRHIIRECLTRGVYIRALVPCPGLAIALVSIFYANPEQTGQDGFIRLYCDGRGLFGLGGIFEQTGMHKAQIGRLAIFLPVMFCGMGHHCRDTCCFLASEP